MLRKIIPILAAAALIAVPVASASSSPGTNPAKSCKAEQSANPAYFAARYGTNANDANAYGKCVSQRSKGQQTTSSLSEQSTGTLTSAGAPGCQFTVEGCTVSSSGTIAGTPILLGTVTGSLTIYWSQATSNGAGGFCAPASGTYTLSDGAGNTITKSESGTVCEVGPTGNNVEHTFTGTYTITGGTGI